ncbi:MAG TPA: hypothetical protein VFU11_05270 [Solirubrobacterales bacterium]|nr:hypothetical protein [Solirubrobacterales bacterium]
MYPSYKLIKEIKRAAGGEISVEGIEHSLALIEASTPAGALMSTLASREFFDVMLDAAQDRPRPELLAWMTVAAAGPGRVRRLAAKRASLIVAPHELVEVVVAGGDPRATCEHRAEQASCEEEWGAWLLLAKLRGRELRRLVERHAPLRRRYEAARREAKRSINPQLRSQLQALGLV